HFTQNTNQAQSDQPVHNSRIVKRLRLPPQAILPKLHHALESPRAKLRYPVTLLAHTLSVLRRILPSRCMDWLLRNIS
ncbi:MAG: short-chain dehydrogenase, partial [Serratia symbiotica]|nr:short-chain dehydrogenase [Serratia symbiotica]